MIARAHRAILRCASLLVPGEAREDWIAEWQAELWYVARIPDRSLALRFCFGSFRDAFWLRRNAPIPEIGRRIHLRSAPRCLALLAALAAASIGFALRRPDKLAFGAGASMAVALFALLVLWPHVTFGLGESAAGRNSLSPAMRLRRWMYLALKSALLAPIVFFGTFDLSRLLSANGIQAHALLLGCILAIRWAVNDQRRRCPVCLRLLAHPTRIGMASQTFLDWYGTELICEKGHGLLHVSEIRNSCYAIQRWTYLDPSWRALF